MREGVRFGGREREDREDIRTCHTWECDHGLLSLLSKLYSVTMDQRTVDRSFSHGKLKGSSSSY